MIGHCDPVSREESKMTSSLKFIAFAAAGLGLALGASAQGDTISKSAAVYGTFQADVTDVKTRKFSSSGDIDKALNNLGGQNADQLSKGWIAYSALIASQNPEYRAAVRDIESFYGRNVLLTGLGNDPAYARSLNGGNSAVSASLSATKADARRLASAAAQVKEQAYSLQAAGWAKAKIGNSSAKASRLQSAQTSGRPANASILSTLSSSNINSALARAGQSGARQRRSIIQRLDRLFCSHSITKPRIPRRCSRYRKLLRPQRAPHRLGQ